MSKNLETNAVADNNEVIPNNENNTTASKNKSKKIIIIVLSSLLVMVILAVVAFVFVINSKSEEAIRVDDIISKIGVVTIDSEEKIINAENEVKALAEDDYAQLDNLKILEDARAEYKRIINRHSANNVIAIISQIGEVDEEKFDIIIKARNQYDSLDDDGKSMVSNYNILEEAETAMEEMSKSRVENVIRLIDNIGNVSENSKDKIESAEKAYKELNELEQSQVTNNFKLTEAKTQFSKINKNKIKEKMDKALSKLNKSYDDVTGVTWYFATTRPEYANIRTFVLPYIGIKEENDATLYLQADYTGENWIFFKKLFINADGTTYTRECDYYDINRDNNGHSVWEVHNKSALSSDIEWLKAVANADKATIRFSGTYSYDLTLSDSDKKAIKDVVEAYELISEYTLYDYNEIMSE